jgi:hypothetical protein
MKKQSRGEMLAALAGAPVAGAPMLASAGPPISSHPDAELLRLGEEFERRYAASLPVDAECKRLVGLVDEEWR